MIIITIVIIIIIIIIAVEKCGENGVKPYTIAVVTKPPDTQTAPRTRADKSPPATGTLQYLHCKHWPGNILPNSVTLSIKPLRWIEEPSEVANLICIISHNDNKESEDLITLSIRIKLVNKKTKNTLLQVQTGDIQNILPDDRHFFSQAFCNLFILKTF